MEHLLSPVNKDGAFLIRESKNPDNKYALSVRVGDKVNHYRIHTLNNNQGFFITRGNEFTTLQDLVENYKKESVYYPCNKVRFLVFALVDYWERVRRCPKTRIHDLEGRVVVCV